MFKAGDVVICIDDSFSDGYMRSGESYTILRKSSQSINVAGIPGWWECERFKVKEKEEGNVSEDIPIEWEVGQEVFCLLRGKEVVVDYNPSNNYAMVGVKFPGSDFLMYFNKEGKENNSTNRCLFFSEPKIIAEAMPPKKTFVPVLKKGDSVVSLSKTDASVVGIDVVEYENPDHIMTNDKRILKKEYWNFYKLGEEVKFS